MRPSAVTVLAIAFGGAAASLGCEGAATSGGPAPLPPGASSSAAGSGSQDPASCSGLQPGPSPIRRLNRTEYNNTVLDLLGDASQPANSFPPEELGNGFGNDASALSASLLLVERYFAVAEQLATSVTASEGFAALVGCPATGASDETACANAFIDSFGARAFRRPVTGEEHARFRKLYDASRIDRSFSQALGDVVSVMLQSPQFLYRVELDGVQQAGSSVASLSPFEMASRLSYLLWGTMPDQQLFDAARAGALTSAEQVREQALRLLADERARRVVRHFHASLFGLSGLDFLNKSVDSYPSFVPELGRLFRQETESFLEHAIWSGAGKFETLLSAPYTFMNARLAAFYGVSGPTGEAFERVELDPARRAGFLTQAGPMAALTPGSATNPVIRGAYVRSRLFCDPPPDPPPALMVKEPDPDPSLTTRERFIAHREDPSCSGCHTLMDPIGFTLENLDGLGLWRELDNGKPIDASGDLTGTDVAGSIVGPVELVNRIAKSGDARRCYAEHWMSFGYGRGFSEQDACNRAQVDAAFSATGGDIRELIISLTQTDAFLYRSVEAP